MWKESRKGSKLMKNLVRGLNEGSKRMHTSQINTGVQLFWYTYKGNHVSRSSTPSRSFNNRISESSLARSAGVFSLIGMFIWIVFSKLTVGLILDKAERKEKVWWTRSRMFSLPTSSELKGRRNKCINKIEWEYQCAWDLCQWHVSLLLLREKIFPWVEYEEEILCFFGRKNKSPAPGKPLTNVLNVWWSIYSHCRQQIQGWWLSTLITDH